MSSSLLQIPAGAFGLIGPKLVCHFCVYVVWFIYLFIFARKEVLSEDKGKPRDVRSSDSGIAVGKSPTLPRTHSVTTSSSSEDRVLLISCGGLLACHRYTCSSWTGAEGDWGEGGGLENRGGESQRGTSLWGPLISMTAAKAMNKTQMASFALTLTLAHLFS